MHIEIAILEDNDFDYEYLCSILNEWSIHTDNYINVTRFKDEKIIDAFISKSYDLLFADIELKTAHLKNGIKICEKLRQQGYSNEIIFLTAFSEYVFEGYNVMAFNYLVKPLSNENLYSCMKRYITLHTKDYYCIKDRAFLTQLSYNEIIYIKKQNHNILLHTKNKDYLERTTLSSIKQKVPSFFIQCHKSCILNIQHVRSIKGTEVFLSDSTCIITGRNYLADIRNALLDLT